MSSGAAPAVTPPLLSLADDLDRAIDELLAREAARTAALEQRNRERDKVVAKLVATERARAQTAEAERDRAVTAAAQTQATRDALALLGDPTAEAARMLHDRDEQIRELREANAALQAANETAQQTIASLRSAATAAQAAHDEAIAEMRHQLRNAMAAGTRSGGEPPRSPRMGGADEPPRSPRAPMTDGTRRANVVAELIKTERDYLDDVTALEHVVLAPLRAGAVIPAEEATAMIKDVDLMLASNQKLLTRLQREDAQDSAQLAHVLRDFIDVALRPYSEYCSGAFEGLTKALLKQSSAWAAFRRRVESDPRLKGLPLEACLIKPVQRICRYPLLLGEVRKYTPPEEPGYAVLSDVIEKFNAAVHTINDIRRESEMMNRALALARAGVQGLHDFEFWGRERRLLREETASSVAITIKGVGKFRQPVFCLMFTDCVVFVRVRSKVIGLSTTLFGGAQLQCLGVCRFSNRLTCRDVPDNADRGMVNVLEFSDSVSEESDHRFLMRCATREVKLEWKAAVTGLAEAAQAAAPRQRSGADRLKASPRMSGSWDARTRTNSSPSDTAAALVSPRRLPPLAESGSWREGSLPGVASLATLPRNSDRGETSWRDKSLPAVLSPGAREEAADGHESSDEDGSTDAAVKPTRRSQTASAVPRLQSK